MGIFVKTILITIIFCIGTAGCQGKNFIAVEQYSSTGSTFSVQITGKWIQPPDTSPDSIILDNNENKTLTVMIQRYEKEVVYEAADIETLEQFIKYYHENVLSTLLMVKDNGTVIEDITVEGMKKAKRETLNATIDTITAKAQIAYMESEKYYYCFTITGIKQLYDMQIEELEKAVFTIKENF